MLNLLQRMGVGQGAKLSAPLSEHMQLKQQQRLKVGAEWQANLPQEPAALSRGWERHKVWEQGWSDRPTSQRGASGRSLNWSCGIEGSIQKWIAPPCSGRSWPNRPAAEGQHSCHLVKTTTAVTTLHELADVPHLTITTNLVDRRTKYYSQTSHLVRLHQSFCL
jgi:hypothetical protein